MKSKSRRRDDSNFILQSYCAFFFHFSPSFYWVFLAYLDLHCYQDFKIKLPKLQQKKKSFRVSARYPFIGQNNQISPVWPIRPIFFLVRNRGCTCTVALASTVYIDRTSRYSTKLTSLLFNFYLTIPCIAWVSNQLYIL